ncbi:MAG TPA: hypothetical protein VKT75_20140 [Acidobacteriaceae bacterium]|nr:hypothetical protein [Acidobacteriaceae bacterium]
MRFIIEIIFCIGAAYGIGWFFSSYYARGPQASAGLDSIQRHRARTLTLVPIREKDSPAASVVPIRPVRDRKWLS